MVGLYSSFFGSFWWFFVFSGLLLLVFGCFYLLIFGADQVFWSCLPVPVSRIEAGQYFLVGVQWFQVLFWPIFGKDFLFAVIKFWGVISVSGFAAMVLSFFWSGLSRSAGFVLCFWFIPSLWVDKDFELGSEVIHSAGINSWFSGFIMCTRFDFWSFSLLPFSFRNFRMLGGSPGDLAGMYAAWLMFCFCAAHLWESKQAQMFVIFRAHICVNFEDDADQILKAHQWGLDLWSQISVEGLGPIWMYVLCGPSCGDSRLDQAVFSYSKKSQHFWIWIFKDYCLVVMLGPGSMFVLGKDIIPTRMLNASRRCMFFVFVTVSKACFGESSIGWRGYAPLNM